MQDKRSVTLVLFDIPDVDLETILSTFKSHGVIVGVKKNLRVRDNKEVLIGFVTFENQDDAKALMDKTTTITIQDKEVPMAFATRKKKTFVKKPTIGYHKTKVHVSGIPPTYTEEKLNELLGNCTLYIPKEKKGYCFADFHTESVKNEIIGKLNGLKIDESHELKFAPAIIGERRDFRFKKNNGKNMG